MIEDYINEWEDESIQFESAPEIIITEESSKLSVPSKVCKCPVCRKPFINREGLENHVYKSHIDLLPEGMSAAQYLFNVRNKKDHGTCVVCKINKTDWDEEAKRYKRFCSEECKNKYVLEAKQRMLKVYGKEHILDDPEHQKKMLGNRSISGVYKFESDGSSVAYTGTYELDFLRFCDLTFGFGAKDVMSCPHSFVYELEGQKHAYIPDFYMPNMNLIIEIKESDNKHPHMELDRLKEKLKDEVMNKQNQYSYIKIVDKNYTEFAYMIKLIRSTAIEDPDFKNSDFVFKIIP